MGTIDTISSSGRIVPKTASAGVGFSVRDLWRWVDGRMDKARSRKALSELSDDQLRDIGVSRREARRECLRPFWD